MGFGTRLLLLSLFVFATAPARADFKAGLAAYQRGDYTAALAEWRSLAEEGNAEAAYRMACLHDRGQGVPPDAGNAAAWYHRAAEAGHPWAQVNLGQMYYWGNGQPINLEEAWKWFLKAAKQGLAEAQTIIGFNYEFAWAEKNFGEGSRESYLQQAVLWYLKAAKAGHSGAYHRLGVLVGKGHKLPGDDREAVEWFRMAAERGYPPAQDDLGDAYLTGIPGMPKDTTQAYFWIRKAAEQGFERAQLRLGTMYADGLGTPKDYAEAARWFRRAFDEWGNTEAAYRLGVIFLNGLGTSKDERMAHHWLLIAGIRWHEKAWKLLLSLEERLSESRNKKAKQLALAELRKFSVLKPTRQAFSLGKGQPLNFRWALRLDGAAGRECPE